MTEPHSKETRVAPKISSRHHPIKNALHQFFEHELNIDLEQYVKHESDSALVKTQAKLRTQHQLAHQFEVV